MTDTIPADGAPIVRADTDSVAAVLAARGERRAALVAQFATLPPARVLVHIAANMSGAPVSARSDEMLDTAQLTATGAIVSFVRKYGRDNGKRVVMLTLDTAGKYSVFQEFVHDATKIDAGDHPTTDKPGDLRVVTVPTHPKVTFVMDERARFAPVSPAEMPQELSFQYHIRSVGDLHIIARCDRLADARRIATALGRDKVWVLRYYNITEGYLPGPVNMEGDY